MPMDQMQRLCVPAITSGVCATRYHTNDPNEIPHLYPQFTDCEYEQTNAVCNLSGAISATRTLRCNANVGWVTAAGHVENTVCCSGFSCNYQYQGPHGSCNASLRDCSYEIEDNGLDDDCDGFTDEDGAVAVCTGNQPDPSCRPARTMNDDQTAPGRCNEVCGACVGQPVDLVSQQAYVGPHEDFRIESDQGGDADLSFSRVWDSRRAMSDNSVDQLLLTESSIRTVLGPGWRHSFDVRLVVHDDRVNPTSLQLETMTAREHLLYVSDGVYGGQGFSTYPARGKLRAVRSAGIGGELIWNLTDAQGTRYEFVHATTASRLHGSAVARLRAIYPNGATGYRIRIWHEQDAAADVVNRPPASCTEVTREGSSYASGGTPTGCDPVRGLLVGATAEWLSATGWVRGAGMTFKYLRVPPLMASEQFLLAAILPASGSVSVSNAAALYGFATSPTGVARSVLTRASACYDSRTATGCASESLGLRTFEYVPAPDLDGWIGSQLIAAVKVPRQVLSGTSLTAGLVTAESFTWKLSGITKPTPIWTYVATHESAGVRATAPNGRPTETAPRVSWTINGEEVAVTANKNGVIKDVERCVNGSCALMRSTAVKMDENGHRATGCTSTSGPKADTQVLRKLDAFGNVLLEVEVAADGFPTAFSDVAPSAGCETHKLASNSVVRRATRNYYSSTGTGVPRLAASVSLADVSLNLGLKFPSIVDPSWSNSASETDSTRLIPKNGGTVCSGVVYDVDAFDYRVVDTSSLNGEGSTQLAWSHRVRTLNGGAQYQASSTRFVLDAQGRNTATLEYLTVPRATGTTAAVLSTASLISKQTREYFSLGHADANVRGKLRLVLGFPDAGAAASIKIAELCELSGRPAYDALGRATCVRDEHVETLITYSAGGESVVDGRKRTLITSRAVSSSGSLEDRYVESYADGTALVSGTSPGNRHQLVWDAARAGASAIFPKLTREVSSDGSAVLFYSVIDRDTAGRVMGVHQRRVVGGVEETRRRTGLLWDGENVSSVREYLSATSSSYLSTSFTRDLTGSRLSAMTEGDGGGLGFTQGTSGASRGLTTTVSRGANPQRSYAYDARRRLTWIANGSTASGASQDVPAQYRYGPQGLTQEQFSVAGYSGKSLLVRDYLDSQLITDVRGVIRVADTVKTTTGSASRVLETQYDHLNRPQAQCDRSPSGSCLFVLRFVYDGLSELYSVVQPGSYSVEGRSFTLTNNHRKGRLSYVVHPAGATIYEYDVLGRVIGHVQYEGTLPTSGPLDPAKMRVFEYTYGSAGELTVERYPSGRKVYYVYGADRARPSSVHVLSDPRGVLVAQPLINNVVYDVDGLPTAWTWGTGSGTAITHTVLRDLVGRVTSISDKGTVEHRLDRTGIDGDGDVARVTSSASTASPSTLPAPDNFVDYTYDSATGDQLKSWKEIGYYVSAAYDPFTGKRTADTFTYVSGAAAGTETYYYQGEAVLGRWQPNNVNTARSVSVAWGNFGEANGIDFGVDGNFEVRNLTWGSRGELASATTAAGTFTMPKDHRMNRWKTALNGSVMVHWQRYDLADRLSEVHQLSFEGLNKRDEYVYLGDLPIAVVHTEANVSNIWWLLSDEMGTPRRAVTPNSSLKVSSRLVMDAWGTGLQFDDRSVNGITAPAPLLPFRLPGQTEVGMSYISDNKWRSYFPKLGIYLSPDPLHRKSIESLDAGQHLYRYAGSKPLKQVDPRGLWAVGVIGQAGAELGHIVGASVSAQAGTGFFFRNPDWANKAVGRATGRQNAAPIATLGEFHATSGYSTFGDRTSGEGQFVGGASVGAGAGLFFSNAERAEDLGGDARAWNLNTPAGSISLSHSNGIFSLAILVGPSAGMSSSNGIYNTGCARTLLTAGGAGPGGRSAPDPLGMR